MFYFCFFETSFEPQYFLGSFVSTKIEHEAQIVDAAVVVVVVVVIIGPESDHWLCLSLTD